MEAAVSAKYAKKVRKRLAALFTPPSDASATPTATAIDTDAAAAANITSATDSAAASATTAEQAAAAAAAATEDNDSGEGWHEVESSHRGSSHSGDSGKARAAAARLVTAIRPTGQQRHLPTHPPLPRPVRVRVLRLLIDRADLNFDTACSPRISCVGPQSGYHEGWTARVEASLR